jgi:hypothetical protein
MAEKHRTLSTDAATRESIKTPELVELLSNHAFGLVDLTQTRLKAIEVLLKKSLPDIQMVSLAIDGGIKIEVLQVKTHAPPAPKTPAKPRVSRNKVTQ